MKCVFIIGCPRSGTTWLQLLLAQHSKVATSQETHLFNAYLQRLETVWLSEHNKQKSRPVGLGCVLTEADFYGLLTDFATKVLEKIANTNTEADVIIEKTPAHIRYVKLILKVFTDAYFIHIIRDPRSVVSSLCNAGKTWGSHWASSSIIENAKLWCSDVSSGREVGEMTSRYKEIHYEQLLNNGPAQLEEIFNWLDLKSDRYFCENAVEACALEKLQKGAFKAKIPWSFKQEPKDFYRKGIAESWRKDLSEEDIRIVEYMLYSLMKELGYEPAYIDNAVLRKPFRLFLHEALDGVEWRIHKSMNSGFRWIRSFV